MSLFAELNKSHGYATLDPSQLSHSMRGLVEAYEYNTIHHARRIGGGQTQQPRPFLDLLTKFFQDLATEGWDIKKDGVSHRRLGWEVRKPTWPESCCIYANLYAPSTFNTNANEAAGEWFQCWTRWFDEKGIPKLGKRVKIPMEGFEQAWNNIVREFEIFQDQKLKKS